MCWALYLRHKSEFYHACLYFITCAYILSHVLILLSHVLIFIHIIMIIYYCYTCTLQADFSETVPISVHLEVSESDAVPPLSADMTTPTLGGPLTPVLRRYIEGDQPVVMAITQDVRIVHTQTHTPTHTHTRKHKL